MHGFISTLSSLVGTWLVRDTTLGHNLGNGLWAAAPRNIEKLLHRNNFIDVG